MTELALVPEVYAPGIDEHDMYIDKIPCFDELPNGIRCPCSATRNHSYKTAYNLKIHFTSNKHQEWLKGMNANRSNILEEYHRLKNEEKNHKIMIATLQKENDRLKIENDKLKIEMEHMTLLVSLLRSNAPTNPQPVGDLLDLDY